MTKRTMITVILLVGLLNASCAATELNDNTMADGLVAAIPFKLYWSRIIIELTVDDSEPLLAEQSSVQGLLIDWA